MLTPREKSFLPEGSKEGQILDAASHRIASPTQPTEVFRHHYALTISSPRLHTVGLSRICRVSLSNGASVFGVLL